MWPTYRLAARGVRPEDAAVRSCWIDVPPIAPACDICSSGPLSSGRFAATIIKRMNNLSKDAVNWVVVGEDAHGQRIDNYLVKVLKGVPKSHIYRILRSGEVRVNRAKVGPDARLAAGDELRIPPIRAA